MNVALDKDMAAHVQDGAEAEGIDVRTRVAASTEIEHDADGRPVAVHVGDEVLPRRPRRRSPPASSPRSSIAEEAGLQTGDKRRA